MRFRIWTKVLVLSAATAWTLNGCNALSVSSEIPLGGSSGQFEVSAGEPKSNTFNTNFDTGGTNLGSGSMRIDPSNITVMESAGGAKALQLSCNDVCIAAGVASSTCSNVCSQNQLSVTVRVDLVDAADPCSTGDSYGPFLVTLDANSVATSVSPPSSVTFQPKTLQAFNAGQARICVTVISPVSGTVLIDALSITAGL